MDSLRKILFFVSLFLTQKIMEWTSILAGFLTQGSSESLIPSHNGGGVNISYLTHHSAWGRVGLPPTSLLSLLSTGMFRRPS
jgi:hypothetical protein